MVDTKLSKFMVTAMVKVRDLGKVRVSVGIGCDIMIRERTYINLSRLGACTYGKVVSFSLPYEKKGGVD